MSALEVLAPFQIFGDVDGDPLEDGYIYVGVKNLNPEVSPVQVYWDAALTIPAPQPIRTLGGYPSRTGTPARMYIDADSYSISVKNKNSTLIYSLLDSASLQNSANVVGGVQVVDSISDLRALAKDSPSTNAFVAGYYDPGDGGGGSYYYDSSDTTSADNGGTIIVATDGGRWKLTTPNDVSVKQFGARGDYVIATNTGTDDTTAFQNALNALSTAGGGSLFIPDGLFKITTALSYQDVPLRIHGAGMDDTFIIQTTAAANALNFTSTITTNRVDGLAGHGGQHISLTVTDLTIGTNVQAGRAINQTMVASTNNHPFLIVERVAIQSVLDTTAGFQYGIYGYNLCGTKINDFYFMGDAANATVDAAAPYYSESGIRLTSDDTQGQINHEWSGFTIYCANNGVYADTHYEGFYLTNFELVFVGTGFNLPFTTCTNFHIANGHIDFKSVGVFAQNISGFHSVDVDYLKHGGAATRTVDGNLVIINSCNEVSVIGGRLWSFTSGTTTEDGLVFLNSTSVTADGVKCINIEFNSITLNNAHIGTVQGCTITGSAIGINLNTTTDRISVIGNSVSLLTGGGRFAVVIDTGVTNNIITDNIAFTGIDLVVVNNGGPNLIEGNFGFSSSTFTFTDLDTTPNVTPAQASTLLASNTGATTITNFDNGWDGQEIDVLATNANTTIQHNASILLKGAVNAALPTSGMITLKLVGAIWYEKCRSF